MLRASLLVLLGATLAAAPPVHAKRKNNNQLLRAIAPVARQTAPAHPFVNLIVRFGAAADGTSADPSTFRARIGKTPLALAPIVENGVTVGMRGTIEPALLRLGSRRTNRLRLDVHAQPKPGRAKGVRDVDRVRFRAVEAENQAPTARLLTGSDIVFPDLSTAFDGSQSHDPESDLLTYTWDFGDNDPSTAVQPKHTFPGGTSDVTVRLTVSDGDKSSTAQVNLIACAPLDPGKTPGTLQVTAVQNLEFGATTVAATRAFTVTNTAAEATSQLHLRIGVDGTSFTANPTDFRLGPRESVPVTVTFTPGTGGHQQSDVAVVACAANRDVVQLLAHGYAGAAPGNGPTLAAEPAFFNLFGAGVSILLPSGQRVAANNLTHSCQGPGNGAGTGDACLVDADCAANNGICVQSSSQLLDPTDLCADGTGGVYLLSDEGTFTDPTPAGDTDTSVTILRLQFDANGNPTDAAIVGRTTSETTQIACDGVAAADDGRLFTAEARSVTLDPTCFRDELEQLVVTRKRNGSSPPPLIPRIDAVEGQDLCNGDIDPVANLEVTRDGSAVFASMSDGGLYQLRPAARFISPDIGGAFQVHPDGSLIIVTTSDSGTKGLLSVYKIFPDQAADGAVRLAELTPCATFPIPNNRPPGSPARTTFLGEHSFAVGRAAPGSLDGTVLVSFFSVGAVQTQAGQPAVLPRELRIQGMAAFSVPAGSAPCQALGLISLDLVDQLAF